MAYIQFEQFLGRGNEKVFWIFSYKHAAGLLMGGFLGRLGANVIFDGVGWALTGMVLGAIVGMLLLTQYHGILVARRVGLLARFYLQRSRRPQRINAALLYEEPMSQPQRMRVRYRNGTPIAIPRERLGQSQRLLEQQPPAEEQSV
jgi:hypothetical protein